jgi:hypothetical protein
VLFDGGLLRYANHQPAVAHGAILVHNGQPRYVNSDITVRDIAIVDTAATAPWQVGVVSGDGAPQERIAFRNLSVRRGPSPAFFANVDGAVYERSGWTTAPAR